MDVTLELGVRGDLSDDDSADSTSLGIPSHVITDLECFRHCCHPVVPKAHQSRNPSAKSLTLPVNLFCYVLRVILGWGDQTRGYQRRVHSSFRSKPVNLRRTERAPPVFPKLVSQFCHELMPILTQKIGYEL